eukprot:COSAG01_NODE_4433_length_5029_cov_21.493103_6_plen_208_part_00
MGPSVSWPAPARSAEATLSALRALLSPIHHRVRGEPHQLIRHTDTRTLRLSTPSLSPPCLRLRTAALFTLPQSPHCLRLSYIFLSFLEFFILALVALVSLRQGLSTVGGDVPHLATLEARAARQWHEPRRPAWGWRAWWERRLLVSTACCCCCSSPTKSSIVIDHAEAHVLSRGLDFPLQCEIDSHFVTRTPGHLCVMVSTFVWSSQ